MNFKICFFDHPVKWISKYVLQRIAELKTKKNNFWFWKMEKNFNPWAIQSERVARSILFELKMSYVLEMFKMGHKKTYFFANKY
jgi:hypothetical protein